MSTGEVWLVSENSQLGDSAIGAIGPANRVAAGEIEQSVVGEVVRRIANGDFHDPISDELGPSAAGGTFSLVVADALTSGRFLRPGANAKEHAEEVYVWLLANKNDAQSRLIIPRVCVDGRLPVSGSKPNNSVVGIHDDEHGPGGCGAQGQLGPILTYIAENPDALRRLTEGEGVAVDDETHDLIVGRAVNLLSSDYVVPGAEIRQAAVDIAGAQSVTTLAGNHTEIVGNLCKDKTRTLNRARLAATYGTGYSAFEIDSGVFPDAAAAIALSEREAAQKTTALLYYNFATTLVLSDQSLYLTHSN